MAKVPVNRFQKNDRASSMPSSQKAVAVTDAVGTRRVGMLPVVCAGVVIGSSRRGAVDRPRLLLMARRWTHVRAHTSGPVGARRGRCGTVMKKRGRLDGRGHWYVHVLVPFDALPGPPWEAWTNAKTQLRPNRVRPREAVQERYGKVLTKSCRLHCHGHGYVLVLAPLEALLGRGRSGSNAARPTVATGRVTAKGSLSFEL